MPGRDAFEISVNFEGFRDAGMNRGYWIDWFSRDFGWGIAEAGHNCTFANPEDWQQAVTGSLLAHMGKHGPMILRCTCKRRSENLPRARMLNNRKLALQRGVDNVSRTSAPSI